MRSPALGGLNAAPQPSSPELTFGVGPASIKVSVGGWRAWAARRLRARSISESTRLLPVHAEVRVDASAEGRCTARIAVVNFSRRHRLIENVTCDQWIWQNGVWAVAPPLVTGLGVSVPPRGIGHLTLAAHLGAGAVRELLEGLRPAQNRRSTPDARLEVMGKVWIRAHRAPLDLRVAFPVVAVTVAAPLGDGPAT